MKTTISLSKQLAALLLLLVVAIYSSDPTAFESAELEDSIEIQKEIEDGEKRIEVFIHDAFHSTQIQLQQEIVSHFHYCEKSITSRSAEKLYILFHRFKSHLA